MQVDPENEEVNAVKRHVSFKGKDVLEIGCGDGRVTRRYWSEPRKLFGIDPDEEALASASKILPKELASNVKFERGEAEKLRFPNGSFDVAFFTWSLCCVGDAEKGLHEAWRVLRPGGTLVNSMPDLLPSLEVGVLKTLGGKEVPHTSTEAAYRAMTKCMNDKMFIPSKEERIFVHIDLDSIEDFEAWLPSYTGPFDEAEFTALPKKAREAMKNFARSLKWNPTLRIPDAINLVSAQRVP